MKKRGAGWIPDYPDQSDYTLEKDSKKLSKQVQSQGNSASIEDLAQKVYEALDILANQAEKLDLNKKTLNALQDDLKTGILGEVEFVTVEFNDIFKEGSVDSSVLLINNWVSALKPFYLTSESKDPLSINGGEPIDVLNSKLTKGILDSVKSILDDQIMFSGRKDPDIIDFNEMLCLKQLVNSSSGDDKTIYQIVDGWINCINENDKFLISLRDRLKQKFESSFSGLEFLSIQFIINARYLSVKTENLAKSIRVFFKVIDDNAKNHNVSVSDLEIQWKSIDAEIKNLNERLKKMESDKAEDTCIKLWDELIIKIPNNECGKSSLATVTYEIIRDIISGFLDKVNNLKELLNDKSLNDSLNDIRNLLSTQPDPDPEIITKLQNFTDGLNNLKEAVKIDQRNDSLDWWFSFYIRQFCKFRLPQIPPKIVEKVSLESPIHSDLFNLLEKEIRRNNKLNDEFKAIQYDSIDFIELVKPIIGVVAQMLMPLGQHSNISDAFSKAFRKIFSLINTKERDETAESRLLIQEILQQQNQAILLRKDDAPIDDSTVHMLTIRALKEISIKLLIPTDCNTNRGVAVGRIRSIFCSLLDCCLEDVLANNVEFLKPKQTKQPLFRLFFKAEQSEKRKHVQFPISRKLRQEHREIQSKLLGERTQSSGESSNKEKVDPDVYLTLPEFVDLSYWFSAVEDQGSLNSCTAHAGIALMEYFQYKNSGTYIDASPLFLYKVTRNLMQKEGDSGASMRDTMKAMVAFGVCPEEHWSYDEADFDLEPPAFCYSFAESFKALKYFRLDHGAISKSTLLAQIKVLLTSEIPCSFGFTLYSSAYEESNFDRGHIPLPTSRDKVVGGHVVVAVGYHDRKIIKNSNGDQFEGALLIRNSWGSRWGQGGYGWMPYEYVIKGLTADWWSLLKAEWLASGNFGAGASASDRDRGGGVGFGQIPPKTN